MADENTPATEPQTNDTPAPEAAEEEVSGAESLEEIEAYWRKRMSNSDKAHAAERKVLEERLRSTESAPKSGESEAPQVDPSVLKQLTQRLEEAEGRAAAAELKAKYPTAVEAIGDAARYMDEARLASLNESLNFDASVPKRLDTNNPVRRSSQPKEPSEMSIDELKDYLKTLDFPSNQ